jgi:23S rRNA pseudouridine2604 synthase
MLRLNKVLMRRLRCSRREADKYINAGYVQVDGQVVTDLATKVAGTTTTKTSNDTVSSSSSSSCSIADTDYDDDNDCYGSVGLTDLGRKEIGKIRSDPYSTILLHKPLGVVSCQPDPTGRQIPAIRLCTQEREHAQPIQGKRARYEPSKTHFGPPPPPQQQRGWKVAGRLDVNSSGLLVLTRSGAMASQILGNDAPQSAALHPSIEKEYVVRIPQLKSDPSSVVEEKLRRLREGVVCATDRRDAGAVNVDEILTALRVEQINDHQVKFVLDRGRRHHLRRMCRAVQWDVTGLKRFRIGRIVLGDLPVGFWRYLRPDESFR